MNSLMARFNLQHLTKSFYYCWEKHNFHDYLQYTIIPSFLLGVADKCLQATPTTTLTIILQDLKPS